ncbi:MAG: hypothetical protein JW891_14400 [Candidatus Lokiarchaeota archaeon]|nr:hypothetical protein [Candidatus Lokiarchaeota archaeon]
MATDDIFNPISSLIFVIISVCVGLTLILKYFKSKDKALIYVGIAWIIIVESWMPAGINLVYLLFDSKGLSYEIRALIGNLFIPLGLLLWVAAATKIILTSYKKILLVLLAVLGIIFELVLFYAILFDITLIIDMATSTPYNMNYTPLWMIAQVLFSAITLITGLIFSWKSIKYDNPEIQLRGKILFVAFISFLIGALLGIFNFFIIGNIILITSSIEFYIGYILPKWIKKKFLANSVKNS